MVHNSPSLLLEGIIVLCDAELVQKDRYWQSSRSANALPKQKYQPECGVSEKGCPYIVGQHLSGQLLHRIRKEGTQSATYDKAALTCSRAGGAPQTQLVDLLRR